MGPRGERRLARALLLVLAVNVAAVLALAIAHEGSDEAPVGGGDGGSPGSTRPLMPRGGEGDVLGEPDEVYEGAEGAAPGDEGKG